VIELNAIKFILEGAHDIAVSLHFFVVAARIFHDLVDHELRVFPDVEALDASFDGDSEAAKEGLVLCHVVGHGEVQERCISHMFPEGRDEE
jgi:hypothetical protein